MAVRDLQLPIIFVLTDDPGTAHTRTCKQPDKQKHTHAHKVSVIRWGFSHKSDP